MSRFGRMIEEDGQNLVRSNASFSNVLTLLTKRSEENTTWHFTSLKPVLNWANVCPRNILRTVRRNMISFLIELLVRRTWFGQFDELYFVLNWLVMRCKLRPELAADAQQTA